MINKNSKKFFACKFSKSFKLPKGFVSEFEQGLFVPMLVLHSNSGSSAIKSIIFLHFTQLHLQTHLLFSFALPFLLLRKLFPKLVFKDLLTTEPKLVFLIGLVET